VVYVGAVLLSRGLLYFVCFLFVFCRTCYRFSWGLLGCRHMIGCGVCRGGWRRGGVAMVEFLWLVVVMAHFSLATGPWWQVAAVMVVLVFWLERMLLMFCYDGYANGDRLDGVGGR